MYFSLPLGTLIILVISQKYKNLSEVEALMPYLNIRLSVTVQASTTIHSSPQYLSIIVIFLTMIIAAFFTMIIAAFFAIWC